MVGQTEFLFLCLMAYRSHGLYNVKSILAEEQLWYLLIIYTFLNGFVLDIDLKNPLTFGYAAAEVGL